MTTTIPVDDAALRDLRQTFGGDLITPGGSGYAADRRVWNGAIDRYPALIALCVDAGDVAAALGLARRTGLPVASEEAARNTARPAARTHSAGRAPSNAGRYDPAKCSTSTTTSPRAPDDPTANEVDQP